MNIAYASIQELHEAYRNKELTVKQVVLEFLSRIAKIDSCEGGLKSVIEVNPDVLFIAESLDRKLQDSDNLPPLFGIPVLVKDNINTGDRLHTSAGSVALGDNYALQDAHIVECLRMAGAVILGKANMTEFANYMSRDGMPSGYSSRGGQVVNPYNHEKDPSGSSSGSAVAVAAGLCTISIGTETSGSIISPASNNGIVGIKPTLGLVSRSGIIPISSTFDTAGPMARTVTDAAILLNVLAEAESKAAPPFPGGNESGIWGRAPLDIDYTKYLGGKSLDGIRIGLNRAKELPEDAQEEDIAIFNNLCNLLTQAGAVLVDNIEMTPHYDTRRTIMQHEFKACINHYLATAAGSTEMSTLKDIIEFNQANAELALKYGQSLLLDSQNKSSGRFTEPAYLEALLTRDKAITEMDSIFDSNNIDILLGQAFVYIAPFTGFPSMTIPIGQRQDNNMPIRAFFTARRFDEATMIKVAYAVENILGLCLRPAI